MVGTSQGSRALGVDTKRKELDYCRMRCIHLLVLRAGADADAVLMLMVMPTLMLVLIHAYANADAILVLALTLMPRLKKMLMWMLVFTAVLILGQRVGCRLAMAGNEKSAVAAHDVLGRMQEQGATNLVGSLIPSYHHTMVTVRKA